MIRLQVGNYVLETELGRGGMGVVYRARHVMLGRPAAVKVLLPQYSTTPDIVQRFFNEAKAATSIRHLGIVEIYDFGVMNTGIAFIAMELLDGESLAGRIGRGRMLPRDSLAIIRQICGALGAAHDAGIVHRDLKPDNVFVTPDAEVPGGERIKLLDFGIAKVSEDASGMATQTRTGMLMGTPMYMAPEQCRGVRIDHRADIYALGCIFYELVTGRPPFRGEGSGDVLAAHIHAAPDPIENVAPSTPPEIARLVHRLLAKNPDDRPRTARQLIEEIDRLHMSALSEVSQSFGAAPPVAQATGGSIFQLAGETAAEVPHVRARNADPAVVIAPSARSTTLSQAATSTTLRRGFGRGRAIRFVAAAFASGLAITAAILRFSWTDPTDNAAHRGSISHTVVTAGSAAPLPESGPAVHPVDAGVVAVTGMGAVAATTIDAAPAAAMMVRVTLDSVPRGAHVWLDGSDLGVTPYTGTLPKTERRVVISLRRDQFDNQDFEASTAADIHANVRLVPRRIVTRLTESPARAHAPSVTESPARAHAPPVTQSPGRARVPIGDDDTPNPLSPR